MPSAPAARSMLCVHELKQRVSSGRFRAAAQVAALMRHALRALAAAAGRDRLRLLLDVFKQTCDRRRPELAQARRACGTCPARHPLRACQHNAITRMIASLRARSPCAVRGWLYARRC